MLRDTFYMLGTSEASAVHVIAYFVGAEAKDVHEEQFGMVEFDVLADHPTLSENGSWPHVFHALIRKFLSDKVLREAYNSVPRAKQKAVEDESEFTDRISTASRRIRQVFTKSELINSFLQGLRPVVRELVVQQVRKMTEEDLVSL